MYVRLLNHLFSSAVVVIGFTNYAPAVGLRSVEIFILVLGDRSFLLRPLGYGSEIEKLMGCQWVR